MLTKTQEQFFSLLRAGLWADHTPDVKLFETVVDWEQIYKIATE